MAKFETMPIGELKTRLPDRAGDGFVAGIARPGGNVTRLSNINAELSCTDRRDTHGRDRQTCDALAERSGE